MPGKILKQVIKQGICESLEMNQAINRNQHGFVKNISCQTNLIALFNRLVDQGNAMAIVYLDFNKPFDKVDHSLLPGKNNVG